VRAAAIAAPVRSPAATHDGRTSYRTAGRDFVSGVRSVLHTPDDHSKKIRNRRLGADPRTALSRTHMTCPALRDRYPGLGPPAGARRNDTGTAGSDPGVFLDRGSSADTAGWPVSAAIAAPPRDTRDCSTGPGDGWSELLFTPLEQTASLSRPAPPLTSPRIVARWIRAQGSRELPTAEPRARSPLCSASRRLLGSRVVEGGKNRKPQGKKP